MFSLQWSAVPNMRDSNCVKLIYRHTSHEDKRWIKSTICVLLQLVPVGFLSGFTFRLSPVWMWCITLSAPLLIGKMCHLFFSFPPIKYIVAWTWNLAGKWLDVVSVTIGSLAALNKLPGLWQTFGKPFFHRFCTCSEPNPSWLMTLFSTKKKNPEQNQDIFSVKQSRCKWFGNHFNNYLQRKHSSAVRENCFVYLRQNP